MRFALLGLGAGGAYALAAQGIVLIYKGSGTVNFAHGAIAMVSGFVTYEELNAAVPVGLALAAGVAAGSLIGLLQYVLVLRRLRRSSAIARLIATLATLLLIQAAATLRYGGETRTVRTPFPRKSYELVEGVVISLDRLILFVAAVAVTLVLSLIFRFTLVGQATSAAAENETSLAALGWSPDRIALVNWAAGGALAGLAGVLIVPIGGLQITALTALVIIAIAAAVVGHFQSFWLALAGGLGIGVAESEIGRYGTAIPGAGRAVPLLVIVAVLVVSGRSLPLRGYVSDRLPSVGRGTAPIWLTVSAPLVLLGVIWAGLPITWVDAVTSSLIMTVLLLSIVLLTGYAGQISLAQYALAGVGAFVAGRLVADTEIPFELAAGAAIVVAMATGALFALPAVRTRGLSLAMVTLGLGVALHSLLFTNYEWTGGLDGTTVGETRLLGLDIDAVRYPERYATLVLVVVVAGAVLVGRIRRSALGHRMLALRGDERAAAALGIGVARTKLVTFALSAGLAAVSGVLTGFRSRSIVYGGFDVFGSIFALAFAVIGGVGYIGGALVGGLFASGGIGARTLEALGGFGRYIELLAAATLILTLLARPDGLVSPGRGAGRSDERRRRGAPTATPEPGVEQTPNLQPAAPSTLDVKALTISYGGITAVRDVDIRVSSGEIVGLIGPNGAGKTTLVDGISGFTKAQHGSVQLDGHELDRTAPHRRARYGIGRSFQGVGLFDDLTVRENIHAATWSNGPRSAIHTFLRPRTPTSSGAVTAWRCLAEFGVHDVDQRSDQLPLAQRRIGGLARALATSPRILILDEPAAGLDDLEVEELRRLLGRLASQWRIGILLIEHNVGLVMSACSRIYVLDGGVILSSGSPDDIQNDPQVIDAYLGAGAVESALASTSDRSVATGTGST